MNEIKYQITQLIFLVLLGLGAYVALTHINTGISYTSDQIVTPPLNDQQGIDEPIVAVTDDTSVSEPENDTPNMEEEETPQPDADDLTNEEQSLVDGLERLITDEVYMKVGSRGTRVGTVQQFLAYYFPDKTVGTDNDYGPGTKTLVEQFQSAEGLSADGQAGPETYQAMIDVIEE